MRKLAREFVQKPDEILYERKRLDPNQRILQKSWMELSFRLQCTQAEQERELEVCVPNLKTFHFFAKAQKI